MKKLVIHPFDPTTLFLREIYEDKGFTVLTNNDISKSLIRKNIKDHDIIIMLGHGNEYGLFGNKRFIIDSNLVYLLREKICWGIWCSADKFFEKYDLKGHYTGMIVSEIDEAIDYYLPIHKSIGNDIEKSNKLFANSIAKYINNICDSTNKIKESYYEPYNVIIDYNIENIFYR